MGPALLLCLALVASAARATEPEPHHHHHATEPADAPSASGGLFGAYDMTRDASGTSWQPENCAMEGSHGTHGLWTTMAHGFGNLVYGGSGGGRGDRQWFGTGMFMMRGQRPFAGGTFGLRAMGSPEPLMGPRGYPLLLQTGETADGALPLIDRQHPHDLFMELAATYSHPIEDEGSVFVYAALPGEPAVGPPAFMHRDSGVDNPEAPIAHHWQDSAHMSYGVLTGGLTGAAWKIDLSSFRGREPDYRHYDIEAPRFDSSAVRFTWNSDRSWSMQLSLADIHNEDTLSPNVRTRRTTASIMHASRLSPDSDFAWTAAWGSNAERPGRVTDSLLAEGRVRTGRHTFFSRAEWVEKDELLYVLPVNDPVRRQYVAAGALPAHLPGDSVAIGTQPIFPVSKLSAGYAHDFPGLLPGMRIGLGAMASVNFVPSALQSVYGKRPTSLLVWTRIGI